MPCPCESGRDMVVQARPSSLALSGSSSNARNTPASATGSSAGSVPGLPIRNCLCHAPRKSRPPAARKPPREARSECFRLLASAKPSPPVESGMSRCAQSGKKCTRSVICSWSHSECKDASARPRATRTDRHPDGPRQSRRTRGSTHPDPSWIRTSRHSGCNRCHATLKTPHFP